MVRKNLHYLRTLEQQFERLNAYMETLDASMKNADPETKKNYEEKIKDVRNKHKNIREKIRRVKESGNSKWEIIGEEAGNFWGSIKKTVKKAKDEYRKGYEEGLNDK